MDISAQLAMEFRGLVTDKFKELDRKKLIKALSEIISDTAFLLCMSNEELITQIQEAPAKNSNDKIISGVMIEYAHFPVFKGSEYLIENIKDLPDGSLSKIGVLGKTPLTPEYVFILYAGADVTDSVESLKNFLSSNNITFMGLDKEFAEKIWLKNECSTVFC